jgi:peroxiredoxin
MPRVTLNKPAPNFTLRNFQGKPVELSNFCGTKHVVLVFNRGFA